MKNEYIISEKEFEEIISSPFITINMDTSINVALLRKIFDDDNYYTWLLNFFSTKQFSFVVGVYEDNRFTKRLELNKSDILKALKIYLKSNHITDRVLLEKSERLMNTVSYETFRKNYEYEVYELTIDGIKYQIKVNDMLSFMEQSNYDFKKKCDDNSIQYIAGIPKVSFIYAIKSFVLKENISSRFLLPQSFETNLKDIMNNYVDIEAINELVETKDTLHHSVTLSDELKTKVYGDMPKDLTLLEKAIYVYIMLCKILTYSVEAEANNQSEEIMQKYADLSLIENITPTNNEVVCFQFNIIFAKFLDELGIKFASNYFPHVEDESYGLGHVNIKFRVGRYLVFADAVESMFAGDLANAKTNKSLSGIQCLNKDSDTRDAFDRIFGNVYELIAKRENAKIDENEHLYEIILVYQRKTKNYHPIDVKTKLRILMDKIQEKKLSGIDAIAYLIYLSRIFFNSQERENNFRINILASNSQESRQLACIISYNNLGLDNDGTDYYLFMPKEDLREISYEEITKMLDASEIVYIEADKKEIPGFSRKRNRK